MNMKAVKVMVPWTIIFYGKLVYRKNEGFCFTVKGNNFSKQVMVYSYNTTICSVNLGYIGFSFQKKNWDLDAWRYDCLVDWAP